MSQSIRFVGLDVHSRTIAIAVASNRDPAEFVRQIANDLTRLLKTLDRLGPRNSLHVAYEAGPTGYGLQRALERAGVRCEVIAPSKMPKNSGDRVKTDRRDALRLAHLLRCGDLVSIHVPDEACEAMRDLLRSREDAKRAQLRARHQLAKYLLRHDRRWPKSNWTKEHIVWIEQQVFEHPAQARVLEECLHAVHESSARIARYDALLERLVPETEPFELGDLRRFGSAKKLMSYLGTTPSEDSSGDRVRRGGITKAGNGGLRRLLVESAWAYRHAPREANRLKKRAERVAPGVRKVAWAAQVRLHARYKKMMGRGKGAQKTLVAIARELAGFIWAVGQEKNLLAK